MIEFDDMLFGVSSSELSYLLDSISLLSIGDTSPCRSSNISNSDQIISSDRQSEHPPSPIDALMPGLPHQTNGFDPTEDLLHHFSLPLTDPIPRMTSSSIIDRAPSASDVLSDVRG